MTQNNWVNASYFPNLFGASGSVTGYLTQYDNNSTNTTTLNLSNYTITSNTVFGIWNMTDDTNSIYTMEAYVGNTQSSPPFAASTWSFLGHDDDVFGGLIGWVHIVLNPANGNLSRVPFGPQKIDADAVFWTNLPPATTKIVIKGNLSPVGRDGVVYYFAEPRPCKIVCPSNIVITACGGTNVYFPTPELGGDCGTNLPVLLSDFPSGSFFPVGTNVVAWHVPGYTNAVCSFTVTVINIDTNPPVLNCPGDIVVYTCGTNAVVNYTVTATDDTGVASTNCSPPAGSLFQLGTNAVWCLAQDACSNSTTCAFNVIVLQKPFTWTVLCPPESSSINITGCPPVMPSLTNLVTISNECPVSLIITQSPTPGTVLYGGLQNVDIWVCPTNNGPCSNCTVIVNATFSTNCCTITCQTNLAVTTCGTSAVVTWPAPAVSGPCATFASAYCTPPSGSTFPSGTNTVNCIATNGAGFVLATCSFAVVVTPAVFTNGYDFLPVTITGAGAKFSSLNGNGFITVTNTGGPFLGFNNTVWTSQFPNLFPASATAPGWIAQADNNAALTNTFYLANYNLSNSTVFGIWNTTEETSTYRIRLLDGAGNQLAPVFNWNFIGYDDDALSGNIGWHHIVVNPVTGFLTPTQYTTFGTDCDAAFWDNLPLNTKQIVVTGNLGANNADGVVFYFAERRRCPVAPCRLCNINLGVSLVGANVVLSWSDEASSAVLEETDELVVPPPGNWTAVTNLPVLSEGRYQVVLPAQHLRRFYRLKDSSPPGP